MNTRRWYLIPLSITAAMLLLSAAQASTNDREYKMGDDGDSPPASNGSIVGTTWDDQGASGQNQLHDLVASGSPVYRTISGRPDGGSGLGIEFNGGSSQYLRGAGWNWPQESASAISGNFAGTLNYDGLDDRGLQFWLQPTATTVQSVVMDSNQHGVRINDNGNFSMRYAGRDTDSGVAVTPSTWYHVMVVRPVGIAGGSRMYVNGIAVAADNQTDYAADTADLVVGSNTAGDDGSQVGSEGFTGGTEEFFSGIVDDLTMFVIGDNTGNVGPPAGQDYGAFDFATENGFAAFTLSGVAGDVDNNGAFEEADKTAFIAGWMNENLVNDIRVGDINTWGDGDLNFDGINDINDLVIIQALLPIAGLSTITGAQLTGVPEPSTGVLLLVATALVPAVRRRR